MLLISFSTFAQNLKILDLTKLRTANIGETEDYLYSKNWTLADVKKISDEIDEATFIYNKSKISERSESLLTISYVKNRPELNLLTFGIGTAQKKDIILGDLKVNGAVLINSKIEDGEIVKVFKNNSEIFKLYTIKLDNDNNEKVFAWELWILSINSPLAENEM